MVRAVKNNCISFLRKPKLQMVSLEETSETSLQTMVQACDAEPMNNPDEVLQQVLSVLPPKCKEVFLLSKLHGLKYQEIATELGISVKTIENQMGKALKLIREHLKPTNLVIAFILISIISNKW